MTLLLAAVFTGGLAYSLHPSGLVGASLGKISVFSRTLPAACDGEPTMGDKSPKATNKKAAQNQAKTNTNTQKKNSAAAAKQAAKAAPKKK